jgi:hypothetical protein
MAIYRLVRETAFDQADIDRMAAAYEAALATLRLMDRDDPITELIAKKIIEVARTGEHDPPCICARPQGIGRARAGVNRCAPAPGSRATRFESPMQAPGSLKLLPGVDDNEL